MKVSTTVRFAAILLITITVGCQKQPTTPATAWKLLADNDMTQAIAAQRDRADAAQQAMVVSLKERLTEVASSDGPVAAIDVCSKEARQIGEKISQEHGVKIGRTSFRLRNASNQAPAWASQLVADRVDQTTYLTRDGILAVLMPIRLQPECLLCHGSKEDILPSVMEALTSHYPEDEATGFEKGDLRGWFWVEVPAGDGKSTITTQ